jgi:U5 snRNP spliceosome subunit
MRQERQQSSVAPPNSGISARAPGFADASIAAATQVTQQRASPGRRTDSLPVSNHAAPVPKQAAATRLIVAGEYDSLPPPSPPGPDDPFSPPSHSPPPPPTPLAVMRSLTGAPWRSQQLRWGWRRRRCRCCVTEEAQRRLLVVRTR